MQKPYPISNPLRAAGLRFKASLTSQSLWSQQGGSISGDPVFSDAGVVLDSNDCVHITDGNPTLSGDYQTSGVTFVFDVNPTFASNDGTHRNFFEVRGTDGKVTFPYFYTDNTFRMYVSSVVVVAGVAYGTWSPFWNESSKNTFVISVKSGNTSVWLNGNLIVNGSATTFLNQNVEKLYIGARTTPGNYAPGTYSRFEIYHWACDSVDEPYLRNGNLIQALDPRESIVTVPMEIDYDNSGLQVTPAIGQLTSDVLMGSNGLTVAEFPTKDTTKKRGYIFDGGDRMRIPNNALLSVTNGVTDIAFTWACVYKHTENVATSRYIFIKGTTLGVDGEYRIYTWNSALLIRLYDLSGNYIGGTVNAAFDINRTHSIVIIYDGSKTAAGIRIYVNEIEQSVTPNTSGVYAGMSALSDHLYPGYNLVGTLAVPRLFKYQLSPMQVKALHSIMMSEVIR